MHWALQYAFAQMQEAFDGLYENMKVPGLTWLVRGLVAPWSRLNTIGEMPSDALGGEIAQAIQKKEGARTWLTEGIYVPEDTDEPMGQMEHAFRLSREAYHVGQTIKDAVRDGRLPKKRAHQLLDEALEKGIISEDDYEVVQRAEKARERYIQVDEFTLEEYRQHRDVPGMPTEETGALASSIPETVERDVTDPAPVTEDDLEEDSEDVPTPRGDGARGDGAPTSTDDVERDDRSAETA
jgi:acyl-CoA dehydrogenase